MSSSLLWLQTETADPISRKLHGKKEKKRGEKKNNQLPVCYLERKELANNKDGVMKLTRGAFLACRVIVSAGKCQPENPNRKEVAIVKGTVLFLIPQACDNKSLRRHCH